MGLEKICQIDQPQHFYCNGEATFFTATVFWGTLGPTRVFGKGGVYTMLLFGFLIGAVLPFPFYVIQVDSRPSPRRRRPLRSPRLGSLEYAGLFLAGMCFGVGFHGVSSRLLCHCCRCI